jgi:hypothetical protein
MEEATDRQIISALTVNSQMRRGTRIRCNNAVKQKNMCDELVNVTHLMMGLEITHTGLRYFGTDTIRSV